MWIKDSKGEPSVTTTVLVAVVGVALIKLMFAGIVIGGFKLGDFSGSDFSLVTASAYAFYWGRRNASVGQSGKEG